MSLSRFVQPAGATGPTGVSGPTGVGTTGTTGTTGPTGAIGYGDVPTGAKAANFGRLQTTPLANLALVTATVYLYGVYLGAGVVVSSISFRSGTTAMITGANQWFVIADASRNVLGITHDDTNTAWGASTVKTLSIEEDKNGAPISTVTIASAGLYYIGHMIKASTLPTLSGIVQASATILNAIPPILCGAGDGSLTNPASCPDTITALTAVQNCPYAWCS